MPAKYLATGRTANKQLNKLPIVAHQKILQALRQIKENPIIGTKLGGKLADYYKLRVGDYRIIYTFNPKESFVEIVKIEHRQGVYK